MTPGISCVPFFEYSPGPFWPCNDYLTGIACIVHVHAPLIYTVILRAITPWYHTGSISVHKKQATQ